MLESCIENLVKNLPKTEKSQNIDLVLEGGAFNGSYQLGALMFLKEMEKKKRINIHRISGCSIGALGAYFFLLDRLYLGFTFYDTTSKEFKTELLLTKVIEFIESNVDDIDQNIFDKLSENKLFISYFDLQQNKQIIQNEFTNKDDLKNALIYSTYVPFITNGDASYRGRYIDGGVPFIFSERNNPHRKILYLSLSEKYKIPKMFSIKNELTNYGRVMEGVLDTFNFFTHDKETSLCSYVNHWTFTDYLILRFKEFVIFFLIYLISIFIIISKYIPPIVKQNNFANMIAQTFKNLYRDYMIYYYL